jgi:enamine deaminase RidA (YjgF/YER057c/UK114 family)
MERQSVSTGTIWEQRYSYCRAVRVGERILVSGTTAADPDGNVVGQGDPAAQARYIFDKIEKAIGALGGRLAHVVRVRIYVGDIEHWEAVAAVHGERFKGICPANTLVQARLIDDVFLVEIEAEAIVGAGDAL